LSNAVEKSVKPANFCSFNEIAIAIPIPEMFIGEYVINQ
jgi:hypothetical protein